jgi:hypothetical protein
MEVVPRAGQRDEQQAPLRCRSWRLPLAPRLVPARWGSAVIGVLLAFASGAIPAMLLVLPADGVLGNAAGVRVTFGLAWLDARQGGK